MTMPTRKLSIWTLLCYSAPGVPAWIMLYAIGVVIPGFYGAYVGLSAAVVGMVLMSTRLLDVLFDFGVGILSDRTRSPIGRRKPWLAVGAVVLVVAFIVQMTPARGSGVGYFMWGSIGFFLGLSLFYVPYDAWGSELAGDYQGRASVFTFRAASAYAGSLIFSLIPILPIFPTTDYSPQVLRFIAWTAAVLMAVTVPLALRFAPKAPHDGRAAADLKGLVSVLTRNRPLRLYVGAALLSGLSDNVFTALVFIYQATYMGFGRQIWLVLVIYIAANFAALPLWSLVTRRIGKNRAWATGLFLTALCFPPMSFLPPGASSLIPMLVLVALAGATYSVANVALPAALGDVVDYETWRSGTNTGGALFALLALLTKFNLAVGAGVGFLLIGWFHYDPAAPTHSDTAILGLKFSHLYLPSLLKFGAIALIWRFPIDARRQSIIKRRLDSLATRALT